MANVNLFNTYALLIFVCISSATATILKDCGSKSGKLVQLAIPGCSFNEDDDRCALIKGESASLEATFQTFNQTSKANLKVWGVLKKIIKVPFVIESDACVHWGVKCPVAKDAQSVMTISLPVRPEYPSIPVDIELALMDDQNREIFCVRFAAELKPKTKVERNV